MGLNIKNSETHRLIQELAGLTGETMTGAVTAAVQDRLDRLRGQGAGGVAERLLAIGRDTASRLPQPAHDADHGELLYGDDGLPR
jgi:antitoxin VapB